MEMGNDISYKGGPLQHIKSRIHQFLNNKQSYDDDS